MASIASGAHVSPLDDLIDNHVEFQAFQAYAEAFPIQQPLDVLFAQEQMDEVDTAMDIEPEIEANICKIHHLRMVWSRTNDEITVYRDLNRGSSATITEQIPSFSPRGSPRPRSGGERLSPFSQFINLEIFDTRPGFQLMTNLPWFRLQSMLEQPGVITPQFSSLFPTLTMSSRVHLPPNASYTGRSPIIANEHFYWPSGRGTTRCPIKLTRFTIGAPTYRKYCPGHEQTPTTRAREI
jgi:hypothetical protein